MQTSVVLQQRLLAEATSTAYQDYFLLAALAGLVAILPALPLQEWWEAMRRRVSTPQTTDRAAPARGPGKTVALASPETPNGAGVATAVREHKVSQT